MRYNNVYTAPANIEQAAEQKPGGLCSVLLFLWQDVENWPTINPQTGLLTGDVELLSGKTFYSFFATEREREFKEEMQESIAGIYHEQTVNLNYGGNSNATTLSLGTMQHHQFGAIIKDRNGEYRLIGDIDSGARMKFDYRSGHFEESRGRNIQFKWRSTQPAPIYNGSLTNIHIAGGLMLHTRFKVGAGGAPMVAGDTVYTNAALANKNVIVFYDREKIPESVTGITSEQYITKTLSGNSITWNNGPVADGSIIEIYTH